MLSFKDDFSLTRLFMTKDINVRISDGGNFIFHCPSVRDLFLNEDMSLTIFCITTSDDKVQNVMSLKADNRLDFFEKLIFEFGEYKQINPLVRKILTSLKQLLPGFKLNFQTKTFELNHLTITKEIWDYITYLVKLSCGEKVSQPLIFDSLEAEAFWKKQQEMDARIKKLKADKEGDPEGLIKNLMAITYSFPSFTIDYLYDQTMAQIHWLRELAAGEVSYRLQSQAAAAGNIKKGNKLNFFIK